MTNTGKGYVIFLAALGMIFTSIGMEMGQLNEWHEVTTVGFVAKSIVHMGAVIGAFVGGRLIPSGDDDV